MLPGQVMDDQSAPQPRNQPANETRLLLDFVRERDIDCPRCGYNLRNLTRPICPECGNELHLKVGSARAQISIFLLTIVPGIFSAVAAVLITGGTLYSRLILGQTSRPPTPLWGALAFGWISTGMAVSLYVYRERYLRLSTAAQWTWAIIAWAVHLLAFAVFAYFMA
jgi:hypothetical protein